MSASHLIDSSPQAHITSPFESRETEDISSSGKAQSRYFDGSVNVDASGHVDSSDVTLLGE